MREWDAASMFTLSRCQASVDDSARPGSDPKTDTRPYVPTRVEPLGVETVWRWIRVVLSTRRYRWILGGLVGLAAVSVLLATEIRTSRMQARWLTAVAGNASFSLASGPSDSIRFPDAGPYDWRLGYARLPEFVDRLETAGYVVEAQARSSPGLVGLIDRGVYPIYDEKTQAGLQILDRAGRDVFRRRHPERAYAHFDDIPPLVVQTLLFLENRELLDQGQPYRNPAIEWDRLTRAGLHHGVRQVDSSFPRLGGSTLATQLEKIRHSPDGITRSTGDKLRQIASASVRAYRLGEQTLDMQRRIVAAYLNSMPLAAIRGYGEVIGLGDGLSTWYGADVEQVNRLLHTVGPEVGPEVGRDDAHRAALAYRQVVSLLVAIRRPSDYLLRRPDQLARDTDSIIDDLEHAGIVTAGFAALARAAAPELQRTVPLPFVSFVDQKPATAIRATLAETLGVGTIYELDRLDLTVTSTLDQAVQEAVTAALQQFADPVHAAEAGLRGDRLLRSADPGEVVYSLVLYERGPDASLLRVQTDSLDQPLDVNDATKLELGSTAKLRTLVTYLEIIAALYAEHSGRSPSDIASASPATDDPITRWVGDYLRTTAEASLPTVLEAALERRYSASPRESFLTGGGVHTFANYEPDDNGRVVSVREGFRQSINLVFIRLLRDIVRYHVVRLPNWSPALLDDRTHPGRAHYLERFADREGRIFLDRFLRRYNGLSGEEALVQLATGGPQTLTRLAAIHRSVRPTASLDEFGAFLRDRVDPASVDARLERLYEGYHPQRWSLADRGALAREHPLELWLVADRLVHPLASRSEVIARSGDARQASYRWLFRTSRKHAQDSRIRTELERDAFQQIHHAWQRLGYPFDRLVPSYATAIGSSGDNPTGLAALMGIIQNRGLRWPSRRLTSLRFGEGTPTETWLSPRVSEPEHLLDPAVAELLRRELLGVVEHGTGRRAAGSMVLTDGTAVDIGGKTGTGDNRIEVRRADAAGRALNRTATFAFLFGDRFYGVVTAYVDGSEAADYRFTSALPVQVFKHLVPTLLPLLGDSPNLGGDGQAGCRVKSESSVAAPEAESGALSSC